MQKLLVQLSRRFRVKVMGVLVLLCLVACSGSDRGESAAAREYSLARDIEGDIDRLDEAIGAYHKIASDFSSTESGKKASNRTAELASITDLIDGFHAAPEDSLPSVCGVILTKAPNYEPVLYRLGNYYAIRSRFYTRMASTYKDNVMAGKLIRAWTFQDSLWSGYSFRPTHADRGMRDVLCDHALLVARMLEGLKRYDEAAAVIDRGIVYGSNKDALAEAKVYGSFYKFRGGASDSAFVMAGEALENEDLEDRLRAKAYHVRGMIQYYRYDDHKNNSDLDNAIKSLNEAVVLDPGLSEARTFLKHLRKHRGTLQAS